MAQITIIAPEEQVNMTINALCLIGGWDGVTKTKQEFAKDQMLRWFGEKIQAAAEIQKRQLAQMAEAQLQQALSVAHDKTIIEISGIVENPIEVETVSEAVPVEKVTPE